MTLHTFAEACDCISRGGAAYRFGSQYVFCGGDHYDVQRRGLTYSEPANFTVEEQHSVNWVLIEPEEWAQREEERHRMNREWTAKADADAQPCPEASQSWLAWWKSWKSWIGV